MNKGFEESSHDLTGIERERNGKKIDSYCYYFSFGPETGIQAGQLVTSLLWSALVRNTIKGIGL